VRLGGTFQILTVCHFVLRMSRYHDCVFYASYRYPNESKSLCMRAVTGTWESPLEKYHRHSVRPSFSDFTAILNDKRLCSNSRGSVLLSRTQKCTCHHVVPPVWAGFHSHGGFRSFGCHVVKNANFWPDWDQRAPILQLAGRELGVQAQGKFSDSVFISIVL
jgi:hypothetical protein